MARLQAEADENSSEKGQNRKRKLKTGPEADENSSEKGQNRKRKLKTGPEADEKSMAGSPGVCYMSRIPPRMDPFSLRDILAQYGDIHRVYLTPQNPSAKGRHKPHNRRGEDRYVEGWIEFTDKRVAKRVASMLNGEQIGGRRKRSWYYDLWNIKYLSKFKWDDLTEEIAYKNAIREQKLSMEISAAKKERDFYLSKVDKARALSSIEERLKKKQKLQEESGTGSDNPVYQLPPKVMRKFPQNKPVKVAATESKSRLSKDTLAGVFGGS